MEEKGGRLNLIQVPHVMPELQYRTNNLIQMLDAMVTLFASHLPEELVPVFRKMIDAVKHEAGQKDFDPLTGLLNRAAIEQELIATLTRFRGIGVGLIVFDIDNFKRINDNYGHPAGDDALRAVGTIVRSHLRLDEASGDSAGRWGGDEMVALLRSISSHGNFFKAAKRIKSALEDPDNQIEAGYHAPPLITVSMSAVWLDWPTDLNRRYIGDQMTIKLLALADEALYEAKKAKPGPLEIRLASLERETLSLNVKLEGEL